MFEALEPFPFFPFISSSYFFSRAASVFLIGVNTQESNDLEYLGLHMVKGGPVGVVERLVFATDIFVRLLCPCCK